MDHKLLSYLSEIDHSTLVTECDVLASLTDAYTKGVSIMEHYDGDDISSFSIFMEAKQQPQQSTEEDNRSVWEKAKGNKNESMIKRIIFYIPRLIKEFFKWLFKENPKDKKQEADKAFTSFDERLKQMTDEEVAELERQMNEELGGDNDSIKIQIDRKTRKIKYVSNKSIFEREETIAEIADNAMNVFEDIRNEFNPENPGSIRRITNRISDIMKGKQELSVDAAFLTVDDMKSSVNTVYTAGATLMTATAEIGAELERAAVNNKLNGVNDEGLQAVSDLSKKILGFQQFIMGKFQPIMSVADWVTKHTKLGKKLYKRGEGILATMGKLAGYQDFELIMIKNLVLKSPNKQDAEMRADNYAEIITNANEIISNGSGGPEAIKKAQEELPMAMAYYQIALVEAQQADANLDWPSFLQTQSAQGYTEDSIFRAFATRWVEFMANRPDINDVPNNPISEKGLFDYAQGDLNDVIFKREKNKKIDWLCRIRKTAEKFNENPTTKKEIAENKHNIVNNVSKTFKSRHGYNV